jgi:uncharacterized membrane protein YphA (DoxX/SURF4 family)
MHALIDNALRSRPFYLLATALLTYVFWWSGLNKVLDFQTAIGEMAHFGLQPAALFAIATIAVQLAAPLAIMAGSRWAWLGAAALAGFTLATIPVAHRFWEMNGLEGFLEKALVQDHLSVIGGLAVAAILAHQRRQSVSQD